VASAPGDGPFGGTISRLTEKGFGFIASGTSKKGLYFHSNELTNVTFEELREGDKVAFDVAETGKGPNAINVGKNGGSKFYEEIPEHKIEEYSEVQIVINDLSKKLAELVASNAIALDEIEWRDLERVIAEAFSGLGFDVTLTPGSKDGGKDVIVEFTIDGEKKSYLIELKHWRSGKRVGRKPVIEFVHVVASEKKTGGLFLATYGFSRKAIEALVEIDRGEIALGTHEKIGSLCRSYVKARAGLWCPPNRLDALIFEDTQWPKR